MICIETATEICSVALTQNGKVIVLNENHEGNKHAAVLTQLIDDAVREARISLKDLSAIAVSMGPGSYTGLRVGVSTAKGLCLALRIPLIAINTLESLANSFIDKQENLIEPFYLIPMLDARRMEVYCAIYNQQLEGILPTEAKIIDAFSFQDLLNERSCYLFGNGATKCQVLMTHKNAKFVSGVEATAEGLAQTAFQKWKDNKLEDLAYFEPYYLKDFVGTKPKSLTK